MQGPILWLTVGDPDAIQITEFQVHGCEFGFCVFDAGEPLVLDQHPLRPRDHEAGDRPGDHGEPFSKLADRLSSKRRLELPEPEGM